MACWPGGLYPCPSVLPCLDKDFPFSTRHAFFSAFLRWAFMAILCISAIHLWQEKKGIFVQHRHHNQGAESAQKSPGRSSHPRRDPFAGPGDRTQPSHRRPVHAASPRIVQPVCRNHRPFKTADEPGGGPGRARVHRQRVWRRRFPRTGPATPWRIHAKRLEEWSDLTSH